MSLKGSKKVDTNRYELEITIDAESFGNAIREAYRKGRSKINVPGFRKGKAPLSIIEKMYGEGVFYEDALNILYPEALESAVKEAELRFVDDKVDFDLVSINKQDGVCFKAIITTYPEVSLKDYKGLTAEKEKVSVTAAEVKAELERMADRNARVIPVTDRAAAKDDIVTIDFEGFTDGVAFDGGKAEGYALTLGSNQFIPGFEDQIIGHNVDDEFDVNVEFPKDYNAENLAGKPAVFKVKVHEIKMRELPAIDDEFAKDVSEFDTLDELKKDIKAKALERKTAAADAAVENQIIDKLVDCVEAEIPNAMFENQVDESIREFDYRLRSQGMDIKTYMSYLGMSNPDDLRANFRPQAEKSVKVRMALEKIVELENIDPSADDVTAEYEKLAQQYNMEVDKIKAVLPESEVKKDVAVTKAMDLVKESAVVSEPAKKTATKKTADKAEKSETKTTAKKTTSTAKKTTKTTTKKTEDK